MALSDEDLLAQMNLQEESPDDPRQRRVQKLVFAKSEFSVQELKAKFGERIWVRCVSECGPWADEKQMKYWKEYYIKVDEAVMLDERRFAVILHSREALAPVKVVKATTKASTKSK